MAYNEYHLKIHLKIGILFKEFLGQLWRNGARKKVNLGVYRSPQGK